MIFTSQLGMLDGKTEKEAIASIANHLRRMQEELEYRLRVLDSSNITEITAGSTKIKTEDGKDLVNLIFGEDGAMSALQQTVDGLKVTVNSNQKGISDMQTQFEQTAKQISLNLSGVTDESGKLTAASIVAAINQTTGDSLVKINADHVAITGYVTVDDLKTGGRVAINAGNIAAGGAITGVSFRTKLEDAMDPGTTITDSIIRFGNIYNGAVSSIEQVFSADYKQAYGLHITSSKDVFINNSGSSVWHYYGNTLHNNGSETWIDSSGRLCLRGVYGTRAYSADGSVYWEFGNNGIALFQENGNYVGWIPVQS